MIIGYIAWPPDNGTYMWADFRRTGKPPSGILCDVCGQRTNFDIVNPKYRPPRTYYDLSSCYDGDYLVSPRLSEFWMGIGLVGLTFKNIPKSSRYLVLHCSNVLEYVAGPNFHPEEYCNHCRQYKSVWGTEAESGEKFKGVNEPITHGVYVSDIHVGYYPQKGPLLIVGTETWEQMRQQDFKGLKNGKQILQN